MAQPLALSHWHWHWPQLPLQLLVAERAASLLCSHRQGPRDVERGGQLFVDIRDPRGLILSVATAPHCDDRAGVKWLELDPARCREETHAWQSKGLLLLGIWHTHAEPFPSLSQQDLKSLRKFGQANDFWPLAIVVGQGTFPENLRAWSVRGDTLLLAQVINADLAAVDVAMSPEDLGRQSSH